MDRGGGGGGGGGATDRSGPGLGRKGFIRSSILECDNFSCLPVYRAG